MAYACNCNGYSGFFDEFMKISEVALPTVGGLSGLQAGYNDSGGDWLAGLLGGLKGVTTGYQQVATMKAPPVQVTPTTVKPVTGVAMPVRTDSLLGDMSQYSTPVLYDPNYNILAPPILPQSTAPTGLTPQQIAAQHAAQLQAMYNAESAAQSAKTNKMLLYGGLGVGALVLLLVVTR